ncbi:MAG: hypothetical protein K0V04_00265 [Deltaproteobacteria bacterium]|nr:hypothetical protein [Deltaproteobacteria bacterium]
MSARLQLPADLLDERRPLKPRVDGELRSTILQLAQLVDRGECLAAAQQAVELLRAEVYDLRLACVYMVGLFVDRGLCHLPALLNNARRLVADELASPPAMRSSPRVLDTTLQWMLQTVSTHIQFHVQQRDETWKDWLRSGEAQLPHEIGEQLDELAREIGEIVEQPASVGVLHRLGRWTRGDLARAMARTREAQAQAEAGEAPQPELPSSPPPVAAFGDGEPFDGSTDSTRRTVEPEPEPPPEPEPEPPPPPWSRAPDHITSETESDALVSLRRKIAGFEYLVERGNFAKAAIVARDVQNIVEHFDPVQFLPSLFAGYFRLMSQRVDQLRPHLDDPDDTPWQALSRFYQADLDGFLED